MSKLRPSKVPGPKAGPNGSFPVGDPTHARMAISGATRSYNAGNISASTEAHIKAEARSKLHHNTDDDNGMIRTMNASANKQHPVT